MNDEIRNVFLDLKVIGERSSITVEYKREKDLNLIAQLKSFIDKNIATDFEDIGFCYWNISDNYALLRDGHSLCENHKEFYRHIINGAPCYLNWLVCDATQRLALEKDGYSSFWWDLYRQAVEQNPSNQYHFAEFHIHRAALYSNNQLGHSSDSFHYAKRNYEKFLAKTESTSENLFYRLIYLCLVSKLSPVESSELCSLSHRLFEYLASSKTANGFLSGEWNSFVTPLDKREQAIIGITSAVNALIYCNDIKEVKDLYVEGCTMGFPKNHYIEKRLNAIQ